MNLYLIIFNAGIYKEDQIYENHKALFSELKKHFTLHLIPYKEADTIPSNAYKMAFIGSGGVEGTVIRNFSILPYPITLLTDGVGNSLAAALEIAAWVRFKDMKVNIIHGDIETMIEKVLIHHQAFAAKRALKGKKIGVIGTPSSWLVASHVDYLLAGQRWGVSFQDFSLREVVKRFKSTTDDEIGVEASLVATHCHSCTETTPENLLRAMRLYKAIRNICTDNQLDAVTFSCFSLINELKTTGCLALSLLNEEGIPAGNEGDLQSIMTLLMTKELTHSPGFIANPTFINEKRNEVSLAHCTISPSMTDKFILRPYEDTGVGISVQGTMPTGDVTLFKCGGECLDEYFASSGYLIENIEDTKEHRTQIKVKLEEPVRYFLKNPLGNHHIIIRGNHTNAIKEFMDQNRCKCRE